MEIIILLALVVLLVIFITRTVTISNKLKNLEWDLSKLKSLNTRVEQLEAGEEKPIQSARHEVKAEPQLTTQVPILQSAPQTLPRTEEPPMAITDQPSIQVLQKTEEEPSRTREEWETFIGGKLLNRIGAFALILGIGFFLKYAFDQNWISETVRVLIGAFVGLTCLGLAYRTHKKGFRIFAQGLVGAGISILYLSVYASFNFYQLMPQWIAFLLMAFVTALTLGIVLFYNSLAVALLGWAGGFLTPIMLSTGQANEVGLFTYIVLLDLGILALLVKRDVWTILEPLTLLATWSIYFLWHFEFYSSDKLFPTVLFITFFWILFHTRDVIRMLISPQTKSVIHHVVSSLNIALFYPVLYTILNIDHHEWMAPATLLVGAVYLVTVLAIKKKTEVTAVLHPQFILTSIALLVVATFIQYHDFTTVILWSIEAIAIVWCGLHWNLRYVWQSGLVLIFIAGVKLLATDGALAFVPIEEFKPVINLRSLTFLVESAALAVSAKLFLRRVRHPDARIISLLEYATCVFLFIGLTVELNDFFGLQRLNQPEDVQMGLSFRLFMSLAVAYMVYSLPFVWLGLRTNRIPLLISGLGALFLATSLAVIRGIAFDPISLFHPLMNVRSLAIVLVLLMMIAQTRQLNTHRGSIEWLSDVLSTLQIALVVLILVLLTGETRDFFEKQLAGFAVLEDSQVRTDDLLRAGNLEQLSLSGVWLIYSVALMVVGIWRKLRGLRIISIALFGITILKIFIYDLSFLETLYRIVSFVGLGLILLAVSYAYQRFKYIIVGTASPVNE